MEGERYVHVLGPQGGMVGCKRRRNQGTSENNLVVLARMTEYIVVSSTETENTEEKANGRLVS